MFILVVVVGSHELVLSIILLHDIEEAREVEAIILKSESGISEVRFLGNLSLEFCEGFLQGEKRLKKNGDVILFVLLELGTKSKLY